MIGEWISPIQPILPRPLRPRLVQQSTIQESNDENKEENLKSENSEVKYRPPTSLPALTKSTCRANANTTVAVDDDDDDDEEKPVDSDGFWINGSDFDDQVHEYNRTLTEGKKLTVVKEDPAVILAEIFDPIKKVVSMKHKNSIENDHKKKCCSKINLDRPIEDVLEPVRSISPININPAANIKKVHKNNKSRLSGRRGSRNNRFQRQNHQQQRRNSFDALPSPADGSIQVRMNATMPASNIERQLDEILKRLKDLETKTKKVSYLPPYFTPPFWSEVEME